MYKHFQVMSCIQVRNIKFNVKGYQLKLFQKIVNNIKLIKKIKTTTKRLFLNIQIESNVLFFSKLT